MGLSFNGGTALCPFKSKTLHPHLVLPRKTCPHMTEKLVSVT